MKTIPKILIDGYNLMFGLNKLDGKSPQALEEARTRLMSKLVLYRSLKKVSITVVFDGADVGFIPRSYTKSSVKVIFSKPQETADEVIKRMISDETHPTHLTVVSSDNEVLSYASQWRCKTLLSSEFDKRLTKITTDFNYESKYDHELSSDELDDWLEIFKGSGEED